MEELRRSLSASGIAIVGVIESRIKGRCIRRMGRYQAICTGCDPAGGHGIELWISTEHPVEVDGANHYLSAQAATLLHAEPRILLVSFLLKSVLIDVLVSMRRQPGPRLASYAGGGPSSTR